MTERLREIGDFKGWVNFEAEFWVEGSHFAPISTDIYGKMVILQLCCWKFSQRKKIAADFYSIEIEFY